jgi:hypothetical protein
MNTPQNIPSAPSQATAQAPAGSDDLLAHIKAVPVYVSTAIIARQVIAPRT